MLDTTSYPRGGAPLGDPPGGNIRAQVSALSVKMLHSEIARGAPRAKPAPLAWIYEDFQGYLENPHYNTGSPDSSGKARGVLSFKESCYTTFLVRGY